MIKTMNEANKFLNRFIPIPDKKHVRLPSNKRAVAQYKHPGELGLKRMKYLVKLMGNPQLQYPTIHVGGTSGKGSTATIIASILKTKYKVGLHTSPHLVKINERIKVSSRGSLAISERSPLIKKEDISDTEFIELINEIRPIIENMKKSKLGFPSYFEIITAMAFLYFAKKKVDIAVIEAGLGGKYDATNVIKPQVAVLTNIGLDHTEVLGETIEEIARDKAGIIKSDTHVVTGVKQPSVIKIIKTKNKKQKTKNNFLEMDFSYKIKKITDYGSYFDYIGKHKYRDLFISLLGEHQVENAVLAIKSVELLTDSGIDIFEKNIRIGLGNAFIAGRLQILKKSPLVVLDGAHNKDKVKALVKSLKSIWPKRKKTIILAIKKDKNAKEMITLFSQVSKSFVLTQYQLMVDYGQIASYDPKALQKIVKSIEGDIESWIIVNPIEALKNTIDKAQRDELILVTGSLYLVGEMLKKIQNPKSKIQNFLKYNVK